MHINMPRDKLVKLEAQLDDRDTYIYSAGAGAGWLRSEELPNWYEPRAFISSGYRPPMLSVREYACSVFSIHNETGNIWTHMLGFVLWLVMCTEHTWQAIGEGTDASTLMALIVGYLMCSTMPLASTLAHVFACRSQQWWQMWWRVDFAAILILWYGGKVLYEGFFAFYCAPNLLLVWLITSAIIFAVLGYRFVMKECIKSVIVLYVYMHVPLLYMTFAAEHTEQMRLGLQWSWIGSACGVIGFAIKQTAFPESVFGEYFQYWLVSHQWWHIFTMAGPVCCLLAGQHVLVHVRNSQCF